MSMSQAPNEKGSVSKSKAQVFGARLFSTLLLWAIVTGVFLSGNAWAFIGLIILLAAFSLWEFFQMTRIGGMPSQPKWGVLVGLTYLFSLGILLGSGGRDALDQLWLFDVLFIAVLLIGGLLIQLRKPVEGKNTITEVAVTVLGFLYVPVLFSFLARLLFLPEGADAVPGAWLMIWVIAVTKFTDMGAYITGSLIGKHKMIPHISPAKTWEGFFGALFFAQLAGCGLFALMPDSLSILHSWIWVIGLGILLALLAVVGDLAESVLKRSIGTKDSGNTLPGIGGALDLIDSICFTAPALYFILIWLNA
ncbi:MAG: phosphatidate cytidylyltransferase [Akkermansiaceae bacterium]